MFQLKIDDDLFEHFVRKFGIPKCYTMMKKAIAAMKDVDDHDRYLMIAGDDRRAIEEVFQTTIDTPEKLARLIGNLNKVKIGGIEHGFSADELARLDMQATFHGRTREVFLREMIKEIADRMLEQV